MKAHEHAERTKSSIYHMERTVKWIIDMPKGWCPKRCHLCPVYKMDSQVKCKNMKDMYCPLNQAQIK